MKSSQERARRAEPDVEECNRSRDRVSEIERDRERESDARATDRGREGGRERQSERQRERALIGNNVQVNGRARGAGMRDWNVVCKRISEQICRRITDQTSISGRMR